jgi:hypothetical protein
MMTFPIHEGYHTIEKYVVPEAQLAFLVDKFKKAFEAEIILGSSANQILELLPNFLATKDPVVLGNDDDGMVVEWYFEGVIFTLAYSRSDYESAYCVQQIQVKE